jgi:hypothetical protein
LFRGDRMLCAARFGIMFFSCGAINKRAIPSISSSMPVEWSPHSFAESEMVFFLGEERWQRSGCFRLALVSRGDLSFCNRSQGGNACRSRLCTLGRMPSFAGLWCPRRGVFFNLFTKCTSILQVNL